MNDIPGFKECPSGWYIFGTHSGWESKDMPRLEFSEEVDEAGMPLWERPLKINSIEVYIGWITYRDGSESPVERWVRGHDGMWISLDSERRTRKDPQLIPRELQ